jgi:hypothetical protein
MDSKDSLTRLLLLVTRNVDFSKDSEKSDSTCVANMTDIEETIALLHLSNGNFSTIAQALDDLFYLNSAASDFNDKALDLLKSTDSVFEKVKSDIDELCSLPSDTLTDPFFSSAPKSPSEAQLAKYQFATVGLEEHLAKMKIFPYFQADDVLSKRETRNDASDDTSISADLILSSKDKDTILTLQTMEQVSWRIVELREQNDIKEERLNLEFNYNQSGHLHSSLCCHKSENANVLTQNMLREIRQLEIECTQLDEELSRKLQQSIFDYK